MATPTSVSTPVPVEEDRGDRGESATSRPVDGLDLLAALSATLLAGVVVFSMRRQSEWSRSKKMRLGLLVLIGGLVGYLLYAAGWLRPEPWLGLSAESALVIGRLTAAGLAFLFALAALVLERPLRSK